MNNENEMPEKIWAQSDDFRNWTGEWDTHGGEGELDVKYVRFDTIPDVAELQRQNAILKKFVRTIVNENCFGYTGEVDGEWAQDQAENCGIILPETVTREMMDEWERTENYPEGYFEEGDFIYNFAPWMVEEL